MKPQMRATSLLFVICLSACGMNITTKNLLQPKADNQPAHILPEVTAPRIERSGYNVTAEVPTGEKLQIDMRSLLDVDQGFSPVGQEADFDWISSVLITSLKEIFRAGYYDEIEGRVGQADINREMAIIRICKPIKIEAANSPNESRILLLVVRKGEIVGAIGLTENGADLRVRSLETPKSPNMPRLKDLVPGLPKPVVERTLLSTPAQSSTSSLRRVSIPSAQGGSALDFYWMSVDSQGDILVRSNGDVVQSNMPVRLQSLGEPIGEAPVFTHLGRVDMGDTAFRGLD